MKNNTTDKVGVDEDDAFIAYLENIIFPPLKERWSDIDGHVLMVNQTSLAVYIYGGSSHLPDVVSFVRKILTDRHIDTSVKEEIINQSHLEFWFDRSVQQSMGQTDNTQDYYI